MRRSTPSSARSWPKFFLSPSTFTANASAIGIHLLIRFHCAQPGMRQLDYRLLAIDIESEQALRHRSRQQVKEDRTDERLHGEQGMHAAQASLRQLGHHLAAHRA